MSELKGIKVDIDTKSGAVTFPETGVFTLKAGASAIFPFNLNMDGVEVRMATVQPFCRFSNNGRRYHVLASVDGIAPEIVLKGKVKTTGSGIKTSTRNGNTVIAFPTGKVGEMQVNGVSFLVLPWEQALNAYLVGKENQHLVISKSVVLDGEKISLICKNGESVDVAVYPSVKEISATSAVVKKTVTPLPDMTQRTISIPTVEPKLQLTQADDRHFVLKAPDMDWSKVNDVFVTFDYRGDRALCMMNGELQTDNLYSSQPWTIGLKRYSDALKTNEMYFYFMPMAKDAPYLSYLDKHKQVTTPGAVARR